MKKIIILLTTLLSLNLFGGLVHKDVDTRVTLKAGSEFLRGYRGAAIESSVELKTYLLKHERLNIYFSGKLADEIQVALSNKVSNNIKVLASFGTERDYDAFKLYQQFGFGIGYMFERKSKENRHFLAIPIEIELGGNYKNYLISITLGSDVMLTNLKNNLDVTGDLSLKLGLGYEF